MRAPLSDCAMLANYCGGKREARLASAANSVSRGCASRARRNCCAYTQTVTVNTLVQSGSQESRARADTDTLSHGFTLTTNSSTALSRSHTHRSRIVFLHFIFYTSTICPTRILARPPSMQMSPTRARARGSRGSRRVFGRVAQL